MRVHAAFDQINELMEFLSRKSPRLDLLNRNPNRERANKGKPAPDRRSDHLAKLLQFLHELPAFKCSSVDTIRDQDDVERFARWRRTTSTIPIVRLVASRSSPDGKHGMMATSATAIDDARASSEGAVSITTWSENTLFTAEAHLATV